MLAEPPTPLRPGLGEMSRARDEIQCAATRPFELWISHSMFFGMIPRGEPVNLCFFQVVLGGPHSNGRD